MDCLEKKGVDPSERHSLKVLQDTFCNALEHRSSH